MARGAIEIGDEVRVSDRTHMMAWKHGTVVDLKMVESDDPISSMKAIYTVRFGYNGNGVAADFVTEQLLHLNPMAAYARNRT